MEKWDREPLSDAEVAAILTVCETSEDRFIVTFLADTGCRVNELLRYVPEWVDTRVGRYGVLTVPVKATSGQRPKTKKPKSIPLSRRLRGCFDENPLISINRSPQHVYNVVKRLGKKAGVEKHVTPHIFRHTFITRCYYEGGLKPEEIGALAGHRDGEMVGTVYLHIDAEKTRSKLEDAGFLE